MCYIVNSGPGGNEFSLSGSDLGLVTFKKGDWIQPHQKIKLKCIHPDGRSDTYLLEPGQRLVTDEEARFEVLTVYPDEVPTLPPQSSPPEPISVPTESPV